MDMEVDAEGTKNPILPGFRFHPTEDELVGFYLRHKVEKKPFRINVIEELNLYSYDPWELPGLARMGERQWFFFVPRDRRKHSGGRINRITASGYWKATGTDRRVYNQPAMQLAGLRKTLVFYKGRAPRGERTDWIMNEYRLVRLDEDQAVCNDSSGINEVTLCRIYKKATSMKSFDRRPSVEDADRSNKATSLQMSTSGVSMGVPSQEELPFLHTPPSLRQKSIKVSTTKVTERQGSCLRETSNPPRKNCHAEHGLPTKGDPEVRTPKLELLETRRDSDCLSPCLTHVNSFGRLWPDPFVFNMPYIDCVASSLGPLWDYSA
eukprot:Gb_37720 [translate_table: standard]